MRRSHLRSGRHALLIAATIVGLSTPALTRQALSAEDRAAIQQPGASYVELLGACKAAKYADLFAPDGYFASTFRGRVQGRERLITLVESERHCVKKTPRASAGVPVMTIEPSADGATVRAMLANNGGGYEDVYVRTPRGGRFRSRTHVTMKELAERAGAQR